MAALLSGEIAALSTGFSEAVDLANAGEVKIIGVTSSERVDAAPDAMTMMEQGIDTTFVNWRGFFGAPGLPDEKLAQYQTRLRRCMTHLNGKPCVRATVGSTSTTLATISAASLKSRKQ